MEEREIDLKIYIYKGKYIILPMVQRWYSLILSQPSLSFCAIKNLQKTGPIRSLEVLGSKPTFIISNTHVDKRYG